MIRLCRIRTILYLLLLAGAVAWASFYGGVLPYMLLFSILFYPIISLLYMAAAFLMLEIYQELPEHRVLKMEEQPYRLTLQNAGFLRINDMQLEMEDRRSETSLLRDATGALRILSPGQADPADPAKKEKESRESSRPAAFVRLLPGERLDISGKTLCRYAGAYDIGLTGVIFRDAFGIFTMRRSAPAAFRVTVMPRVTDMAADAMDFENLRSSSRIRSRVKYEPIPSNTVRPYYPGDPRNRIHWKASASSGELLVRLPDELDTREIYLVMEAENTP